MDEEIKALREEIARLRERVAVLESKARPANTVSIDWSKPLMVGTPRFLQQPTFPPGTITC